MFTLGCFPQKQHDGARNRPVGLEFAFSSEQINVRPVDLAGVDGLADRLPISARMVHILQGGPMTLAAIADELGAKLDSVIKASNRGKSFTRVQSPDGITRIALVERRTARLDMSTGHHGPRPPDFTGWTPRLLRRVSCPVPRYGCNTGW